MFVVQNDAYQFLTVSNSWSDEYPDAAQFESIRKAEKTLLKTGEDGNFEIIENYGMENQSVAHTVKVCPDQEY